MNECLRSLRILAAFALLLLGTRAPDAADTYEPGEYSPPPSGTGLPGFPGALRILGKTPTSLSLDWAPSDLALRFHRVASNGTATLIAERPPRSIEPVIDRDLYPDSRYCYRMEAYNDAGAGPSSGDACAYTNRPTVGRFVAKLRVLTYNVYGVDDQLCPYDSCPWGANLCDSRATAFGENVALAYPPYDIVNVQEYYDTFDFDTWSCGSEYLRTAIQSDFPYSVLFRPTGEWTDGESDGGLGIFTRHPITDFAEFEFNETKQRETQGFTFTRIHIPEASISVDVYNVHTYGSSDGCDADCHKAELQTLAEQIHLHSAESGNPVLVTGDFNIDGPPGDMPHTGSQYVDAIQSALRLPRDLWLENHPTEPGYTKRCHDDTIDCWYAHSDASRPTRRIDYIIVPTDPYFTNSPYEIVVANRDDVAIASFLAAPFAIHVSDHIGVEATIEIRRRQQIVTMPGVMVLVIDS